MEPGWGCLGLGPAAGGKEETSPEGRSSLKSVSPGALMGLLPSGDAGRACSGSVSTWDPLTKPQHHGILKSPDGVPNSDTVVLQRNKKVKLSS